MPPPTPPPRVHPAPCAGAAPPAHGDVDPGVHAAHHRHLAILLARQARRRARIETVLRAVLVAGVLAGLGGLCALAFEVLGDLVRGLAAMPRGPVGP